MAERDVEIWTNATRGRIGVKKFNARGDLQSELVKPGGKVTLTPQEREINSERAANAKLDVFQNGHLTPVKLIDGTEDAREIASNPNLKGESDLRDMFGVRNYKAFEKQVGEISNVMTLERLLTISDDEEVNATVKQVQVIEDRLVAVGGRPEVEEPEDTVGARVGVQGQGLDGREASPRAISPR